MTLAFLRHGLPESYSFSVTELAHTTKLDQNESAIDLPHDLKRDIASELASTSWNRYPQPAQYVRAKRGLAAVFNLDPREIALTIGGDQAIAAAFAVGGGPGRCALWFEPTYPYIAHCARQTFTDGQACQLSADNGWIPSVSDITASDANLIALVSPNNPTGGMVPNNTIDAATSDSKRLVLLDEAYADFSGVTRIARVDRPDNLLVARSLSKSMLASVRLGFIVGHPEVIAIVERVFTAPYHLSSMQLLIARRYGDIRPHVVRAVASVVRERTRVIDALTAFEGVEPVPSTANFVLFGFGDAERAAVVHGRLAESGVRVRDVSGLDGLAGYLRVTIGIKADNDRFLEALTCSL